MTAQSTSYQGWLWLGKMEWSVVKLNKINVFNGFINSQSKESVSFLVRRNLWLDFVTFFKIVDLFDS